MKQRRIFSYNLLRLCCLLPFAASLVSAEDFQGSSYALEYDREPISYSASQPDNAIEQLQKKILSGESILGWDAQFGYLPALLDALHVPKASQLLVFSKTSLQRRQISPTNPRSLYFNDDIYLGYIPGAAAMEISVADPKLGGVFYRLEQDKADKPKFERSSDCMQCHGSQHSLGVPGHFLRSVPTDEDGELDSNGEVRGINHTTPFGDRWAGWYVTGTHGQQTHRGNLIGSEAFARAKAEPNYRGNLTDLGQFFDQKKYTSQGSDIVAAMVLEHQAHMHNYITRLSFDAQLMMAAYGHIRYLRLQTEAFLRFLLFTEEAPLTDTIQGNPEYASWFTALGPHDSKGRSLRDFDLKTRLFKYPCSFLLYSDSFDAMPAVIRESILQRLHAILTGQNQDPQFAKIKPEDRQAILEILRETKPSLPDYWR